MIFASDIAERAEQVINELDNLELNSLDQNSSSDLAKDLEEILKMQQLADSPQVKIADLRLKIKNLEADIESNKSDTRTTSVVTIKAYMEKHDELRRLKAELKKLELDSGIVVTENSLPLPDVGKLQSNYEDLVEERNQMQKQIFEMEKKQELMASQIRNEQEQKYLESLNKGTGSLSTITNQPSPSRPSKDMKIPEPNPYVEDDTISSLADFLQSEGVLPSSKPSSPSSKISSGSKFSGLLEEEPASNNVSSSYVPQIPRTFQPAQPVQPIVKTSPSTEASPTDPVRTSSSATVRTAPPVASVSTPLTSLEFVQPVESQPVTTSETLPLFFTPPVTPVDPIPVEPMELPKRRVRSAVSSEEDVYMPEIPESLLRSLQPSASVAQPDSSSFVPVAEQPSFTTSPENNLEDLLGSTPAAPVSLSNSLQPPSPITTLAVKEPVIPAPPPIEVISSTPVSDDPLLEILGHEAENTPISSTPFAEPPTLLGNAVPTEASLLDMPAPSSEPDFSIFEDSELTSIPGLVQPSTLADELAAPPAVVPVSIPIVEDYQPAPELPTPPTPQFDPLLNDKIPIGTLEFYDLPSFEPTPIKTVEEEIPSVSINKQDSEVSSIEPTLVATPASAVLEVTEPVAVKRTPPPNISRNRPPSSTVTMQIETLVDELSGQQKPADYTEFYITTQGLTDIILNSPELKEVMDKAITGKDISSYAELWARAQKYGYNYPGLSSMIRKTLRENGIHRIRTNANGTARLRVSSKLLEAGQPEIYYITGVAMLGKVGVVWSKPFYIQDHAGQDNPILLENADAIWLE